MREPIYQGRILDLVRLDGRWEVVEKPNAVAVLAERDGLLLGVRQRRPAIGRDTWELPAGLVDPGESPADAAARELAEETQLRGRLRLLQVVYASPGFTNERVHLFEAGELRAAPGIPDEEEALSVEWRDPLELWNAVREEREATSGPTLVGVALALARAGRLP